MLARPIETATEMLSANASSIVTNIVSGMAGDPLLGRLELVPPRLDQAADDAEYAEQRADRHGQVGPGHRERLQPADRLHPRAPRVVHTVADHVADEHERRDGGDPVDDALAPGTGLAMDEIHADHRALPEGCRRA